MKNTKRFWIFLLMCCLLFSFAACRKEMPAKVSYSAAMFSDTATQSTAAQTQTKADVSERPETKADTTRESSCLWTAADTSTAKETAKAFTGFSYATAARKPSVQTTVPHTTNASQCETATTDKQTQTSPQSALPTGSAHIVTEPSAAAQTVRVVVDCRHACAYRQAHTEKEIQLPDNANGIILDTAVVCTEEDTALSVLQKALSGKQLMLDEIRGYVRGIGGLYEKDCGSTSGWMYSVNGETPVASAKNCPVTAEDTVKFYYVTQYGDTP